MTPTLEDGLLYCIVFGPGFGESILLRTPEHEWREPLPSRNGLRLNSACVTRRVEDGQHFGFYRLLAKRFPHAIYYRVTGETVRVYAVLDCRQSPSRTAERLKNS